MRTQNKLLASAIALLVASAVASAQRSSPQFSFPPPNGDVFSGGSGQDLVNQLGQSSGPSLTQSQQQQQQSQSQSQSHSQQSPSASQQSDSQLIAQSQQPALVPRQPQAQQQQQQQLQSRPSQTLVASGAPSSSAANRHKQQQQSSSQQQVAHHQPQASSVAHSLASRHPANLHLATSSSSAFASQHAQSQQAAIEAGRKADATQASLAASAGQAYHCPDLFGYFRHHKSCDKYYACENGTATLKLCGNGLMFDDSDPRRENCAYPFSVDCGERTEVEGPISTPHCPRLYGLFPDTGNCRVFYSCWNGEASRYECPAGLAYDSEHRVCVWADHVDRCDQSEVSDGFVCPDPTEAESSPGTYSRHAHPTDCRKFYVCIEGVARPYGCSIGTVFNVDSLQCDEPENVSGCEKYYGDMDSKLAKKLAKENVQQSSGSAPARNSQQTSNSRVISSSPSGSSSAASSDSS